MKTIQLFFVLLLQSNGLLWAQTYLAYTKQPLAMVDSSQRAVKHLAKGDALYILTDKHYHGHVKAVHVKTHQEGFIPAHDIVIEKEIPFMQSMSSNFTKSEIQNPELVIRNSSHAPMTIKLGEHEYDIKSKESKSLHLPKGKYYYRVTAPDLDHYYGVEILEEYKRYDWDFYVDEEKL